MIFFSFPARGLYKTPSKADIDEYTRRQSCGLYNDITNIDGKEASSWEARKIVCSISSSIVGLSCPTSGFTRLCSSGIIIEMKGVKRILTSAYILGDLPHPHDQPDIIDIYLPDGKRIDGSISYMDKRFNILMIHANLEGMRSVSFETSLLDLGFEVVAVSRLPKSELKASWGQINIRIDHLESDDLMSSSCLIGEWGIGGALIDLSGMVVGMNFFSNCSTPFMPSSILVRCVEHLLTYGNVIRPCVGIRIRSPNELKLAELELVFQKFPSITGVIVKEVMKGSLGEENDIRVGDVIISCNYKPINSAIQFGEELFNMVEVSGSPLRNEKRRTKSLEVVIQRPSSGTVEHRSICLSDFAPVISVSWPVLPVPPSIESSMILM
ncbi:hypothetical protein RND81_08G226400 [Saponaria officinalis]|uniref:PDZ domain-containing protein n=1 Tax=Saponaria officinalis TaxID=3572 RepID=A0AAW1JBM0_SAPOF